MACLLLGLGCSFVHVPWPARGLAAFPVPWFICRWTCGHVGFAYTAGPPWSVRRFFFLMHAAGWRHGLVTSPVPWFINGWTCGYVGWPLFALLGVRHRPLPVPVSLWFLWCSPTGPPWSVRRVPLHLLRVGGLGVLSNPCCRCAFLFACLFVCCRRRVL